MHILYACVRMLERQEAEHRGHVIKC